MELLLRQSKKMSAPIISSGIFDDRYDVLKVSAGSPLHASELYLWKCENHIRIKYIDIVSECAYNGYADTVSEMCEMIRYIR